jgi:hypothetical protein
MEVRATLPMMARWELPCFNAQKNVRSLSDLSAKRDAAVGKSRGDTGDL